jgi:hypothetical protein
MEFLFEILFEIVGEIILQVVFEILVELGLRRLRRPVDDRKPMNTFLAAFGYAAAGAVCGAVSLAAFPHLFIASQAGRIANLVLTPIAAGIAMSVIGAWRTRRGDELVRLDRFAYGFLFALAMAAVRYYFGS